MEKIRKIFKCKKKKGIDPHRKIVITYKEKVK